MEGSCPLNSYKLKAVPKNCMCQATDFSTNEYRSLMLICKCRLCTLLCIHRPSIHVFIIHHHLKPTPDEQLLNGQKRWILTCLLQAVMDIMIETHLNSYQRTTYVYEGSVHGNHWQGAGSSTSVLRVFGVISVRSPRAFFSRFLATMCSIKQASPARFQYPLVSLPLFIVSDNLLTRPFKRLPSEINGFSHSRSEKVWPQIVLWAATRTKVITDDTQNSRCCI